jgi:hypothetical protein
MDFESILDGLLVHRDFACKKPILYACLKKSIGSSGKVQSGLQEKSIQDGLKSIEDGLFIL